MGTVDPPCTCFRGFVGTHCEVRPSAVAPGPQIAASTIASLAHGARALCPQTNLFLIGLVLFLTGHLALGLWHCVRPEGAVCRSKHGLQAIGDPAALARRLLDFDERSFGAVSSRLATAAIARKGAAGSHPLSADILLGCWSSRELRCVIAVLEGSPSALLRVLAESDEEGAGALGAYARAVAHDAVRFSAGQGALVKGVACGGGGGGGGGGSGGGGGAHTADGPGPARPPTAGTVQVAVAPADGHSDGEVDPDSALDDDDNELASLLRALSDTETAREVAGIVDDEDRAARISELAKTKEPLATASQFGMTDMPMCVCQHGPARLSTARDRRGFHLPRSLRAQA